jgi:hypothetical protein
VRRVEVLNGVHASGRGGTVREAYARASAGGSAPGSLAVREPRERHAVLARLRVPAHAVRAGGEP